jgi:hypothetical protein
MSAQPARKNKHKKKKKNLIKPNKKKKQMSIQKYTQPMSKEELPFIETEDPFSEAMPIPFEVLMDRDLISVRVSSCSQHPVLKWQTLTKK